MMPTCTMNETKLEVNENYEEAELSDVDDDVFVRGGGRNGFRLELYDTAKKPLMTPRRKSNGLDIRNGGFHTEVRSSPPALRMLCMPICYILIATFAMLGVIAVIAFLSHYISIPLSIIRFWRKSVGASSSSLLPCDNFHVEDVWVRQFPKLLTESAFRTFDVNNDGIDDIIFGYATGADGYNVPKFVCDIYFPGQDPCYGGVVALDGRDGSELWRHWTEHEVFALNCNEDMSRDGTRDCLISGRAGVFCAINGRDGSLLWSFLEGPAKNPIMNVYTPQFIRDLNGDSYLDLIAIHGGDPLADPGSKTRLSGRILVISGKDGQILQWVGTGSAESYYSPQVLTRPDGTDLVLFGTGGETHAGGLYVLALQDLYKGLLANAKLIYKDDTKGVMVPPVITDINGDGMDDIVMAMFNSTVIAFDGNTFQQIWNHTFPSSETYTTPTPGYYNEDLTPDFLVKYQTGPGFPIYYHAQTTVLDGRTGQPFLDNPIIDSIGSQASTPLIRVQGYGNDIFLYWSSNCKGFEGNSTQFAFAKGTTVHEQSRSDFCKLRFDSTMINQLRMFNRATGLPGTIVYDSDSRRETEYNGSQDTSLEGQAYLQAHPEMWTYYGADQASGADYKSVQPSSSPAAGESGVIENYGSVVPGGRQMGSGQLLDSDLPLSRSSDLDGQVQYSPNGHPYGPRLPSSYAFPPLSSQPELTENVKYPMYHTVRKHGKFQAPPQLDMNVPIAVNRRGRLEQGRSVTDRDMETAAMWRDLYGSPGDHHSASNRGTLNGPQEDIPGMAYGYDTGDTNSGTLSNPEFSQWSGNKRQSSDFQYGRRGKRHIGPHDMDGIQRLISTGTLVRPLNDSAGGIDLVFGTYWFFPAKTQGILPKDRDCIQQKLTADVEQQRFQPTSKYYGMDHDQYEDTVTKECIEEGTAEDGDQVYESQSAYNPFAIHMGQMSVYRLHISCSCSAASLKSNTASGVKARCGRILPFEEQPWSAYMGSAADSYFPFRPPSSPLTSPNVFKP